MKLPRIYIVTVSIATSAALVSCTGKEAPKEPHGRPSSAERKQSVQAVVNAGPQTKSWQTPEGTVIELTIPKAGMTGMFLESQRCIVWRDAVTKTSSLHCDREELEHRDYPSDRPEHQQ